MCVVALNISDGLIMHKNKGINKETHFLKYSPPKEVLWCGRIVSHAEVRNGCRVRTEKRTKKKRVSFIAERALLLHSNHDEIPFF